MKQILGDKKHRMCEVIAGRSYRVCYVNGGRAHGVAECWFGDGEYVRDADRIDMHARTAEADIRDGQRVGFHASV